MRLRYRVALLLAGGVFAACATTRPPPEHAPAARPPSALDVALAATVTAFRARNRAGEDRALAEARALAGDDLRLGNRVALTEAALDVEREDLDGASSLVLGRIAAAQQARDPSELFLHDRMIFVCEARDDRLCALLEALEMRTVVERDPPPWPAAVRQGYYWQRAHTLRQLAETLTGNDNAAAILYAKQAQSEFAALAKRSGHSLDSIPVLDEEFEALDGHCPAALAIARALPVDKLDPQDMYTTSVVFESCGDHDAASALRARIEAHGDFGLFDAVYRLMARRADARKH